ncbi:Agrin, partial [Trachymyrmex zeteki]
RAFFLISEPCEKIYCAWGATCIVSENGKGLCQCSTDCPLTSDPVCGSDDVTYTNHCHLRQASCQNRKNIRLKHKGACAHPYMNHYERPDNADAQGHESSSAYPALKGRMKLQGREIFLPSDWRTMREPSSYERLKIPLRYFGVPLKCADVYTSRSRIS